MNSYQLEESNKLQTSYFLRLLNLIAVGLELFSLYMFIPHGPMIVYALHGVSLMWSIFYHLVPCLRTFGIFRFFAHTVSTISLMFLVFFVYALIINEDGKDIFIWVVIVLYYLPTALVGLTLLLLLNFDAPAESAPGYGLPSTQIVYVAVQPQTKLHQNILV